MRSKYRDLLAWQRAMDLVDDIYMDALSFPKYEMFALSGQMRRAAISIPCNIAEGHARGNNREFRRFLRIARGSAMEIETQILIAVRQDYISERRADALINATIEVARLINGLIRSCNDRLRTASCKLPATARARRRSSP